MQNFDWLKHNGQQIATLRGIAVLLVFFSHLNLNLSKELLFISGRIGVVLFFLISGILAYSSRYKKTLKQYIFNRFCRMYPVYWLLLILACITFEKQFSIMQILTNFTLFQEFLGYKSILGASWMMPIQIIFFIFMAIYGVKELFSEANFKKLYLLNIEFTIVITSVLTVLCGTLRYFTSKPWPTAIFLLINVSFLGILYYKKVQRDMPVRIYTMLLLFEISLLLGGYLSYGKGLVHGDWISYFIAYNLGFFIFMSIIFLKMNFKLFIKLGEVGFTFFLGAEIPYSLIKKVCDLESGGFASFQDVIIKFIAAIVFSILVTKLVEIPILKWSKNIEKAIR